MSQTSRIAALKAALELRSGADTAATIIQRAEEFDAWIVKGGSFDGLEGVEVKVIADGRDVAAAPAGKPVIVHQAGQARKRR